MANLQYAQFLFWYDGEILSPWDTCEGLFGDGEGFDVDVPIICRPANLPYRRIARL